MARHLVSYPQRTRDAVSLKIRSNEIKLRLWRVDVQQKRDRFCGSALHHQQDAEVIVRIGVLGIDAQGGAKLALSKVEPTLGCIGIPEIVQCLGRAWLQLKCMLKCFDGVCKILLIGFNNSQQVVTIYCWMGLELFKSFRPSLRNPVLCKQILRMKKGRPGRIDLRG